MSTPFWVSAAADTFWEAVGELEPFPRDLRAPISFALPVAIVSLPRLHIRAVEEWMRRQEIDCSINEWDRPLRAGLIARTGHGLIFLDGSDQADEQRFSLAHELAHFLLDYWSPRQRAVERLGSSALEILDGGRTPRADERIDALLSGAQLSYHVHLLNRERDGAIADSHITRAEYAADLVACELLAPAAIALDSLATRVDADAHRVLTRRLVSEFGFPAVQASAYAKRLVPSTQDMLLKRLGLVP